MTQQIAIREKIWYEDPAGFLTSDNLIKFIPDKDMTFEEQLNAVVRLTLYFSIVILIVRGTPQIMFVPLAAMLFTYVLYSNDVRQKQNKKRVLEKLNVRKTHRGEVCVRPTPDNPFMNVSLSDLRDFPSRPAACDVSQSIVKKDVERYFNKGLPRDIGDIFHKQASDRQYFTNPVTTIPNDQSGFASWLYQTGKTCKEGNGLACPGSGFRG